MQGRPQVVVLRLAHRPGRDERLTTHVGLTARALGADRVIFPENATDAAGTVEEVTDRFGGPFEITVTSSPLGVLRGFEGRVVHLTMYGERIQDVDAEIRAAFRGDATPLLVIVGAGKVPYDAYERANWNVAVTNQPHSEVAALAVFLDRLFDGDELDREWDGAERSVIPQAEGKRVEDADPDE